MRAIVGSVLMIFLLSACGTTADGPSGPGNAGASQGVGESIVTSANGIATIAIAEGSLPEGTTIDDIGIDVVTEFPDEDGYPVLAVVLTPHGTLLSSPATVTLTVPDPAPQSFVIAHQHGTFIRFLTGEFVVADDGMTSVRVETESFSALELYRTKMKAEITATPAAVEVDEAQTTRARITIPDEPFAIVAGTAEDEARLFVFSTPQPIDASTEGIWRTESTWEPAISPVEFVSRVSGFESEDVTASCIQPNERSTVGIDVRVQFATTLLSVSEPIVQTRWPVLDKTIADSFWIIGEPNAGMTSGLGEWLNLATMEPGANIEAWSTTLERVSVPCAAKGATPSTSSTTSTTVEGANEGWQGDPEGDPKDTGDTGTTDQARKNSADVIGINVQYEEASGTYTVSVRVKGDGQGTTMNPLNKWYIPGFTLETENGSIQVEKKWRRGEESFGTVETPDGEPIEGAEVTAEWLNAMTMTLTVTGAGEGRVKTVSLGLNVRFVDEDDNNTDTFLDTAQWVAP